MPENYLTELLDSKHNRKDFTCGKSMLDNYLYFQAKQDMKKNLSACFVWKDTQTNSIKGYYTLSNNSIPLDAITGQYRKKLPPAYHSIPTTLLDRLAVDIRFQKMKTGQSLLMDALKRSCHLSKSLGSFAVVVAPLDDDARKFYDKYGFISLIDSEKMFLPLNVIKQLFE
jgi:predicted GNAT family N-acyltransferase